MRLHAYFEEGVRSGIKLSQLHNYAGDVYGFWGQLASVGDGRKDPTHKTFTILNGIIHSAFLRIPSLHDLEAQSRDPYVQHMLGHKEREGHALFSDSTSARVLNSVNLSDLRKTLHQTIHRANRNKAFRDDTFGTVRTVAVDAWEVFCSYERCCDECLERMVTVKVTNEDGEEVKEKRKQYFHRTVVAMLVAPTMDMVLDIEMVRNKDLEDEAKETEHLDQDQKQARKKHEGELTAAKRLMGRLKKTYGRFIDVFVLDALYANGPMFTLIEKELGYSACVVTKKKNADPLRFANDIWEHREKPDQHFIDAEKKESVDIYTLDHVTALSSFKGSVDMVKALVKKTSGKRASKKPTQWVFAKIGSKAKDLSPRNGLQVTRGRWHIENTGFHQWVTKWNLGRCFTHKPNAIEALLLLFIMAFNLMQLFIYRRLGYTRKRKSHLTIQALIARLHHELGTFQKPIPWQACLFEDSG